MVEKFDLCPHLIRLIVIRCGQLLFPEEKNITILYEKTASLIGLMAFQTTSSMQGNHLPAPHEMAPARICPKCGKKTFEIFGLCPTCQESEGGKFRTLFECSDCHHKEKSEKPMVVWLQEMGVDFRTQSKSSLGIKTITDEGSK